MPFQQQYGPEVRAQVLKDIMAGKSLRAISEQEGMPAPATVVEWVKSDTAYAEQYARAKEVQAHLMAEEIISISDESGADVILDPATGKWAVNGEVVARARLRADSRKWLLSKMLPKVYGEKMELEAKVKHEGPVTVEHVIVTGK